MPILDVFDEIVASHETRVVRQDDSLSRAIDSMNNGAPVDRILRVLSKEPKGLATTGLFLLSEANRPDRELVVAAIQHVDNDDWQARAYLANYLLFAFRMLGAKEIEAVLPLCGDPYPFIREKMVHLIRLIGFTAVRDVVSNSANNQLKEQIIGPLQLFSAGVERAQYLIDATESDIMEERVFASARILNWLLQGKDLPPIPSNNEDQKYIVWQMKRDARAARIGLPRSYASN